MHDRGNVLGLAKIGFIQSHHTWADKVLHSWLLHRNSNKYSTSPKIKNLKLSLSAFSSFWINHSSHFYVGEILSELFKDMCKLHVILLMRLYAKNQPLCIPSTGFGKDKPPVTRCHMGWFWMKPTGIYYSLVHLITNHSCVFYTSNLETSDHL